MMQMSNQVLTLTTNSLLLTLLSRNRVKHTGN